MVQEDDDEGDDEDSFVEAAPPSPTSPDSDALQIDRGDNIRVFVRVRPLNAKEDLAHVRDSIVVDTALGTVHFAEPPRSFAFDGVLGESALQEDVFQLFGTNVADACLSGYNGSIYVYGQTGSGKTYTMQGAVDSVQSMHHDEKRGLMCRILDFIFAEISRRHRKDGSVQHTCKCSYLEIYKEQITDLLEPSSNNLQIREDTNRGVYVERLSEHSVWTASDAFHVLWKGLHQRHVAATQMNELSSRSHSVFTLKLEASNTTSGGVTSTKVSRLNLIDLAGSERQTFDPLHPAVHESIRVKEAGAINRSLSALTNVIMSLSHRRKPLAAGYRQPFVRYRDSKLTFLLRDSLGGNSKTIIAACISPSALCFGETLSTLKFAARAKHIRCTAVMNEEYSGTVESLMLEVKSLRQQLDLLSSRGLLEAEAGSGTQLQTSLQSRGALRKGSINAKEAALEALVAETLQAACCKEDLQSLHGPRRVRRLQILLAAALDRERRCELRRHKMDKYSQRARPTHFVAIQLKSREIQRCVEQLQQWFVAQNKLFERCLVPIKRIHTALLLTSFEDSRVNEARQAYAEAARSIREFLGGEAIRLKVEGVGCFGGRVVFARVRTEPPEVLEAMHQLLSRRSVNRFSKLWHCLSRLSEMTCLTACKRTFMRHGFPCLDDTGQAWLKPGEEPRQFRGHSSFLKVTKAMANSRTEEERNSYRALHVSDEDLAPFRSTCLGSQLCADFELLSMLGCAHDGYYPRIRVEQLPPGDAKPCRLHYQAMNEQQALEAAWSSAPSADPEEKISNAEAGNSRSETSDGKGLSQSTQDTVANDKHFPSRSNSVVAEVWQDSISEPWCSNCTIEVLTLADALCLAAVAKDGLAVVQNVVCQVKVMLFSETTRSSLCFEGSCRLPSKADERWKGEQLSAEIGFVENLQQLIFGKNLEGLQTALREALPAAFGKLDIHVEAVRNISIPIKPVLDTICAAQPGIVGIEGLAVGDLPTWVQCVQQLKRARVLVHAWTNRDVDNPAHFNQLLQSLPTQVQGLDFQNLACTFHEFPAAMLPSACIAFGTIVLQKDATVKHCFCVAAWILQTLLDFFLAFLPMLGLSGPPWVPKGTGISQHRLWLMSSGQSFLVLQLELSLRHSADTNDVPFIDLARALIEAGVRVEVTKIRCRAAQYEFLRAAMKYGGALVNEEEDEGDEIVSVSGDEIGEGDMYLNNTLERKEQYFDALRDYFSRLVDYAAGEACYLPEFTARLVLLRQQLANATASDSRHNAEMLDGTIEAFLAAEEGLFQDGPEGMEESPSGLCYVSTQNLLEHELSTRSRSYSYGYLLGEAARRNGRRSTTHMKQLALSNSRLPGSLVDSPIAESDRVGELGQGVAGPLEQELAELRAENKLLRRQLESHPELFRLSAENRLLREHMAMLVQQKASSHQEPDFYQHQTQRHAEGNYQDQPEKEMSLARTTSRLLSTTEDEGETQKVKSEVGEGKRVALKHFPGIEEVTHLSSSDSELDDEQPQAQGHREPDRGLPADVTSFLPAMARQVQELFRIKDGMQDQLRQRLRQRCQGKANPGRFIPVTPEATSAKEVRVEPQELSEALQGATEALQHAEAMLAKGGCGDLFVGIDEGGVLGDSLRRSEGMDERDVFLSLMRSLPGESQALNREGSSSQLSRACPLRSRGKKRISNSLQSSSSSAGGGCLQRMKPTLQEMAEASPQITGSDRPVEQDTRSCSSSENLQLTIQQVQSLSKQLENIGEMYKDVKGQLEPMQQEYLRRLDECRFLEAQCRRLDVHCHLLEERVQAAEASGTIPRNQPLSTLSTRAESQVNGQPLPQSRQSHFMQPGAGRFIPVNSVHLGSVLPSYTSQGPTGLLQMSQVQTGSSPSLPLQRSVSLIVLPTTRSTSWAPAPAMTLSASARQLSNEAGLSNQQCAMPVQMLSFAQEVRRVSSEPQLLHFHSAVSADPRLSRLEGPRHGGASTIDEVGRERVPHISGFNAVSAVNAPAPAPAFYASQDAWGLQGLPGPPGAVPPPAVVPLARPEVWRFDGACQHSIGPWAVVLPGHLHPGSIRAGWRAWVSSVSWPLLPVCYWSA
eukprot:s1255_g25.t1